MKQLFKSVAVLALLATVFTACEDSKQNPIQLADVQGEYEGTFDFVGAPSEINPDGVTKNDVAIAVKVEGGKVILPEFPAATLVEALLGEDGAAGIIPMLGKLSYEGVIGEAAATEGSFSAPLTTGRLDIPVGTEEVVIMTVKIDIESPENMVYIGDDQSLTFVLKTVRCTLSTTDGDGEPFELVNTLTFKVKKK